MLKWVIAAVIIYGGFVALLYLAQRSLQYFPERRRTVPSAVGLSKAEEVVLDAADSERVIVWHVPPCDGQPVFLYFHGNGGSLRWREERFHDLIADGSGLVALSYRGYGGSTGHPTEKGLIEDAKAAYAFSVAHYPAERLVLWGESLAPRLRSRLQPKTQSAVSCWKLLLLRPSMSARTLLVRAGAPVDEGPVSLGFARWQGHRTGPGGARRERFDRPHGARQVPVWLIRAPKRFVSVAGGGHNDLGAGAVSAAKKFIAEK